MNKLILIVALALAFLAWDKHEKSKAQKVRTNYLRKTANSTDACTGKEKCALIYLAPWCPSCRSQLPAYKQVLTKANSVANVGLKIVVGAGSSPEENDKMILELGPGALADHTGEVGAFFGVNKYPSYFVLDKNQKPLLVDFEAFQWINQTYSAAR